MFECQVDISEEEIILASEIDHAIDNSGSDADEKLIRLIAPRYPRLNIFSHIAIPPLGLMYIGTAANLTGRYRVEIIDENNTRIEDHRKLQEERPADVVGFYCGLSTTIPRVFELAGQYKSMGVLTIAGGGHVDALPDEALANNIDVVVRGEGEDIFIELLDAHFARTGFSDVPGIVYLGDEGIVINEPPASKPDLATIPDPDFSLIVEKQMPVKFVPISRTRGCNFKCEFCCVNARYGGIRVAPPEKTLAHLEKLVKEGHRRFFFVDDNLTLDRDGAVELCDGIAGIQRKYKTRVELTVQVRTDVARDPRLMEALRDAGAKVLCVGIESPLAEDLRNMNKGQKADDVEADLRALRRNGFLIHGMFIFGYPSKLGSGTTTGLSLRERANKYIGFIKRVKLDTLQVLKAVPVPGSPLAARLKAEGRIYPLEEVGWEMYDGNFLCYQPDPGDNAVDLQEQATRIMTSFYSRVNMLKLLYLGPLSPFDWVFFFIRRGAQRLRVKCREFEEKYRRPAPASNKWGEFIRNGLTGATGEIYRTWRNTIIRIAGSFVLRKWSASVNLDVFRQKLRKQQERIINAIPEYRKMRREEGS